MLALDERDTNRSELGELLFRLKYRSELSAVPEIVKAITDFLRRSRTTFDLIVPVPPAGHRPVQPVIVLAKAFGEAFELVRCRMHNNHTPTNSAKGHLGPRPEKRAVGRAICCRQGLHTAEKYRVV